ncbi:MAG: CehA/McbA family metallohydrolase [Gemmataceae bacterium]|nr:CehA/McbA family metallohydrolase [Gemmataceae bacterium]
MKRRTFLGTALGLASGCPLLAALRREQWDEAVDVIERATTGKQVDAAVLHVVHKGESFTRHFGKAASGDAMFLLGSISKPINVTAVMTLFDQGKFQLIVTSRFQSRQRIADQLAPPLRLHQVSFELTRILLEPRFAVIVDAKVFLEMLPEEEEAFLTDGRRLASVIRGGFGSGSIGCGLLQPLRVDQPRTWSGAILFPPRSLGSLTCSTCPSRGDGSARCQPVTCDCPVGRHTGVLRTAVEGVAMKARCLLVVVVLLTSFSATAAKEHVLDGRLHHLRNGKQREWRDFPEKPEGPSLVVRFQADANAAEQTLRLRQQDVKQTWKVLLNGKERGRLHTDENDMVIYLPLPSAALVNGENTLQIEQVGQTPDDIRVGEISLDDRPVNQVLSEAMVEIGVTDAEQKDTPLPCRITVLNSQGALMTVGARSGDHLAVRPGVIYTGSGRARFGLPAGTYTIHAGRGFAYGIDTVRVTVQEGETARRSLRIRREVLTAGYVSCDPHVHTFTHSRHGDATIEERMLTLAGEGIELPIATDHNVHVDFQAMAVKQGMRRYFTPVIGNEVTTAVGHFCVFPVAVNAGIPDYKLTDWKSIFESIAGKTGAKVVILNHARDLHSGYRPFGPKQHNAVTGENLDGWTLKANAMEVVNSGAMQTDGMRLYHDWFAMLNRGTDLTPVGASDSHDVSRFIVGQGRTYIRVEHDDPAKIDVNEAVANFLAGRVMVSLGLLTEITVNDKYGPGDLAPATEQIKASVRVLGPSWVTADKVELFANGRKIHEAEIRDGKKGGIKWSGEWLLPRFAHDAHLVAIATGPGVREPYWPIAKPYQPTSPVVNTRSVGSSGAVWIDGDGDGKRTCAADYARRLVAANGKDVAKLIQSLSVYDDAVAVHAAALLHGQGTSIMGAETLAAARKAGVQVERGFQAYFEACRQCQIERTPTP